MRFFRLLSAFALLLLAAAPTAVFGQAVMAEPGDLLGAASAQHFNNMGGAKALPGPRHHTKHQIRLVGPVDDRHRVQAHVAIAAILGILAKIGQQGTSPTPRRLAIADQLRLLVC